MTSISHLCTGSSGQGVRQLQERLNSERLGIVLKVDGKFGLNTYKALRTFQRRERLKIDGVLGQQTAKALGWRYTGGGLAYTIRLEKVPLPPKAPPMQALSAVLQDGFLRYGDALINSVGSTGLTDKQMSKITDDLRKVVIPAFLEIIQSFVGVRLNPNLDVTSQKLFADSDIGTFRMAILMNFDLVFRLGKVMKDAGGVTREYAKLYERGIDLGRVADMAGQVLKGEREAAFVIVEIKLAFDAAIGPIPLPA